MGIESVAVYSEADAHSLHVAQADEAVCIGPAPAAESYLRADRILEAARETAARRRSIPGYGFLSENADFAEACAARRHRVHRPAAPSRCAPSASSTRARELAAANDVPLLPGSRPAGRRRAGPARGGAHRLSGHAEEHRGRRRHRHAPDAGARTSWPRPIASVERLARANFKDAGIFLEKYVEQARHIEVQIFGDGHGNVVALGERDCSVQRRNQKVIEETPAPNLLRRHARSACSTPRCAWRKAVDYRIAGTVEFVLDAATGEFYFLEVNTRLQVEHGVTEEVTGVDLVEWMVRQAAGDLPPLDSLHVSRAAHRSRCASTPRIRRKNFQPCSGTLTDVDFPHGCARRDLGRARQRSAAVLRPDDRQDHRHAAGPRAARSAKLRAALAATRLGGIETNLEYLRQVVRRHGVRARAARPRAISSGFAYRPRTIEVIEPGVQTTVQDWPGRLGYWDVGVPPSGPMDALALRLANRLLGNRARCGRRSNAPLSGPTLQASTATRVIALCGAPMRAAARRQAARAVARASR